VINSTVQDLREFLIGGREELLRRKPSARMDISWLREYSNLIDETLQRIYNLAWQNACASLEISDREDDPGRGIDGCTDSHTHHGVELALLAIGGYGRAELCPFSDIDIAFVPGEEEHPLLDAVIKEAFRLVVEVLIDGARLDVGYAYRPISDAAHLDHTAKAALLESRLVAGSARLQRRMREDLHHNWDAVEFLLDKVEERRQGRTAFAFVVICGGAEFERRHRRLARNSHGAMGRGRSSSHR
jgi:hypothetical protein